MGESKSKEILNDLVKIVTRLFYDDKYTIVMDMFTRELVFRDDVLAYRLKLNTKELNRILARLKDDRLLRAEVRFEKNALYEFGKALTKSYYYLDYKQLVDVVKYKIFKMRKYFEDRMKSDLEHVGYLCKKCNKIYNSLEVQSMLDISTFSFRCETCTGELEEHRNELMKNGPQEAHTRLMEQCSQLIELLKKTENIVFPHFDVIRWIETNPDSLSIQMPSNLPSGSGALSGSDQSISSKPSSEGTTEQQNAVKVDVDIRTDDKPVKSTVKDTSFDNSLPLWHRQSTVTDSVGPSPFASAKEPIFGMDKTLMANNLRAGVNAPSKISQCHIPTVIDVFVPNENLQIGTQNPAEQTKTGQSNQKDVMVEICGESKPFSQVTEDDKNRMTEDEYSKYYQIFMDNQ